MGVHPDAVDAAMPVDEGTRHRWQETVGRWMTELPASVQATLKPLVDGLTARVDAAIAALSMTTDQILTTVANPPASVAVTNNLSTGGTITANGAIVSAAGVTATTGRFDTGLYSLDARNFVVVTNYAASWIDVNGHLGISPSSRRFKRDIETWHPDVARLFEHVRAVRFHYDVPDQPYAFDQAGEPLYGPHPDPGAGPWQYGFIAEELVEAGLEQFTFKDADGLTLGINYDRVVVALFDVMRRQEQRLSSIEQRLDALEG